MKLVVSGASGLVGSALVEHLQAQGHDVWTLVRRHPGKKELFWDVRGQQIDSFGFNDIDAVVHLAGESIAGSRWSENKKCRIKESRVAGTRLLCRTLAALKHPPKVLVSASAVGFYGDGGDQILTEDSPAGTNFLAEVCTAWEAETRVAKEAGIRVVNLRVGIVLAKNGGALKPMVPAFRMGLGGPLGTGQQWMSWIALPDLVRVIVHCMDDCSISGPVLGVSPTPVTQKTFARALGRALRRPALLPAPGFALKLLMGEMGQQLLLDGQRCIPRRLNETGFEWHFPDLLPALKRCVR